MNKGRRTLDVASGFPHAEDRLAQACLGFGFVVCDMGQQHLPQMVREGLEPRLSQKALGTQDAPCTAPTCTVPRHGWAAPALEGRVPGVGMEHSSVPVSAMGLRLHGGSDKTCGALGGPDLGTGAGGQSGAGQGVQRGWCLVCLQKGRGQWG